MENANTEAANPFWSTPDLGLLYEQVLLQSSHAIYICNQQDHSILFANNAILKFTGGTDVNEYLGKKCYETLMHRSTPCPFCNIEKFSTKENYVRNFYYPYTKKTLRLSGKLIEWQNSFLHIEYITDITEETDLLVQNRNLTFQLCDVINNVPTGVCLYKWDGVENTPLIVSDAFTKLLGISADDYLQDYAKGEFSHIHPEDREVFLFKWQKAFKTVGLSHFIYRLYNGTLKKYIWVALKANTVSQADVLLTYVSFVDITPQVLMQQQLKESRAKISKYTYEIEERFGTAAKQAGLITWIYQFSMKRIVQTVNLPKIFGSYTTLENIPNNLLSSPYLHPDDIELTRDFYKKLLMGEKNLSCVSRWKSPYTGEWLWYKIFYTTIFDAQGKPQRAIGTAVDISALMAAQQQLEQCIHGIDRPDGIRIASLIFNVSKGVVIKHVSDITDTSNFSIGASIAPVIDKIAHNIIDKEQRENWKKLYACENIIKNFYKGEDSTFFECQRVMEDGHTILWTRDTLHFKLDMNTGDLIAIAHLYDINERKQFKTITNRIVHFDYEFLFVLDVATEKISRIISGGTVYPLPSPGTSYTAYLPTYLDQSSYSEFYGECLQALSLETIKCKLSQFPTYSYLNTVVHPVTSAPEQKLWRFIFLDDTHSTILLTRSDMTQLYKDKKHTNEMLASALLLEQQAHAKQHRFLNQLSTEIMTSVNTVLGLSSVAAHSLEDKAQLSQSVSHLYFSAQYMYNLISSFTALNSFESAAISPVLQDFSLNTFLEEINLDIYPEVTKNKVDYHFSTNSNADVYYYGNVTCLKQAISNLLFFCINAASANSRITLKVEKQSTAEKTPTLQFIISSTDYSLPTDALPYLFFDYPVRSKALFPANTNLELNLILVKKLVESLGGNLHITSDERNCTVFQLEVKLETSLFNWRKKNTGLPEILSQARILLVDGNPQTAQESLDLLNHITVNAQMATTDIQAFSMVQKAALCKKFFHIIIIQGSTGIMDVSLTAQSLQELSQSNPLIIMTTDKPNKALQNAFSDSLDLVFPYPKSTKEWLAAFKTAIAQKNNLPTPPFSFIGKRILLAKQNKAEALAIVEYLKTKGLYTIHVENGLKALEIFSKTEKNFFHAILMDEELPLMDGFQTARNIRHLSNADSSTIPILLLTETSLITNASFAQWGITYTLPNNTPIDCLDTTLQKFIG
ncbi:MAG: PAS domain-containing protein [Oscillospiraceae bacterium]|nr:PAS domain-containing protein [Oscillospiraceae bacterium]